MLHSKVVITWLKLARLPKSALPRLHRSTLPCLFHRGDLLPTPDSNVKVVIENALQLLPLLFLLLLLLLLLLLVLFPLSLLEVCQSRFTRLSLCHKARREMRVS